MIIEKFESITNCSCVMQWQTKQKTKYIKWRTLKDVQFNVTEWLILKLFFFTQNRHFQGIDDDEHSTDFSLLFVNGHVLLGNILEWFSSWQFGFQSFSSLRAYGQTILKTFEPGLSTLCPLFKADIFFWL